jgi:Transcriptional regulator, AbiEi antitoxin, Type IV TA system
MLKMRLSMEETENHAAELLEKLLREIPALKLKMVKVGPKVQDTGIDIIMRAEVSGVPHLLVCEVKHNGQPRYARDAVMQLRDYITRLGKPVTPIFIAPYVSPVTREFCRQNGVSFLDFEGNARLAFGTVFIDRVISDKPATERREFKSLFTPKSAQVLRILMRNPNQLWRVADLAHEAQVSLGHVSNVRTALLDREWAEVVPTGLHLTVPDALLDAWKASYEGPNAYQLGFYTTLHGIAFDANVREFFAALPHKAHAALASFSAANWIAPYARTGTQYFYADKLALPHMEKALRLSSQSKGENVIVYLPKEQGVFLDSSEPVLGIRCTSPLQTYLDLSRNGERGEEAAEHLRRTKLTWQM